MSAALRSIEDNLRDLLEDFYSEGSSVITNSNGTTTLDPLTGETIETENAVLYYLLTDIQNEIYKLTSMRSRHIKSEQGVPQVKELAFSPDEQLLFDSLVKDAVNDVFKILCGYTKNLNNAFLFDAAAVVDDYVHGTSYVAGDYVKYTDNKIYKCILATSTVKPDDATGSDYWEDYSFLDSNDKATYIIELPRHFNANYLNTLDNNVNTCLKKYILKEWYRNIGLFDDYKIELFEWEKSRVQVMESFLNKTVAYTRMPRYL